MERKSAIIAVYALSWAGTLCLIGAVFMAPMLRIRQPRLSSFLYVLFAPFCHQIPSRCFHLAGFPLAVCARCLGIYAGFGAGLIPYAVRRGFQSVRPPDLKAFLLISGPIAIDVTGNALKLWNSSPWLRFGLAAAWATFLPFFFISGLVDAWDQIRSRRRGSEVSRPVRR